MNTSIKTIGKVALCGVCAVTMLQTQANGQTYTLTDGTSSAVYSPGTVGGMTAWMRPTSAARTTVMVT